MWLAVLVWAAAVTAIHYLIDDRHILPTVGNPIAAVVDGVLAAGLGMVAGVAFPWVPYHRRNPYCPGCGDSNHGILSMSFSKNPARFLL